MNNLDDINLEQDIDKLYKLMNDSSLNKKHEEKLKLNKIRSENHKRYYDINMVKLKNLPEDFNKIVNEIEDLYKKIIPKNILNETIEEAIETKKTLDLIIKKIMRIEKMIKTTIKELEEYNDTKQSEFNIVNFKHLDIDEKSKKDVLNLYNELILYNAVIEKDIYSNLKRQLVRKEYINEINRLVSKGIDEFINDDKKEITNELNDRLDSVIDETNDKIQYLSDLMVEDSQYEDSFNDFVAFYNKIIAYDDTSYGNVKQTLDILEDDNKFTNYVKKFENNFIDEREKIIDEEEFIYNKVGLKNIKISLDYISSNYMDILDKPRKMVIDDIYARINSKNLDIDIISKNLNNIVKYIWTNTITNISKNEDFYFLCSNSQFKEPKTEAILLSRNILNRMDDYLDYQIGFICNYKNNILYITENDDIMSVKHDDLSKLKTPKQIEQEYINFNIVNKIALDGYMTNFIAVYYIDDNNEVVYNKALELSKENNLPLIKLKKN